MYTVPEFVLPPEPLEVTEGEPFNIISIATGKPTPQLSWYKDGELLNDDESWQCESERDDSSLQNFGKLVIKSADLAVHDGKVAVEATNEAGNVMREVDVVGKGIYSDLISPTYRNMFQSYHYCCISFSSFKSWNKIHNQCQTIHVGNVQ